LARRDCRRLLGSAEHNHTIVKSLKKPTALPSKDGTDGACRSVHSASTIGQIVVREIDCIVRQFSNLRARPAVYFGSQCFAIFCIGANRDGLIGGGD
jgi:hypothetical protein